MTRTNHELAQGAELAVGLNVSGDLTSAWNRMPPTQLCDDLGPGRGYTPTFTIPAIVFELAQLLRDERTHHAKR